jgi:glycosyltransferase involved in cell wall biosynthesis
LGRRLKVLISAFACDPFSGSEEGVGWGWVKNLARYNDIWVISADFHRPTIEKAIKDSPENFYQLKFHFVKPKTWHYSPTKKWKIVETSILKPVMNNSYRLWQRDAFRLAKDLHDEFRFDIVHQLTYVGFRFPGYLWKLGRPFVWGPIGGLENTHWSFLPEFGIGGGLYYAGRNLINSFDKKYLPGPKKAFRKARGGLIAATSGIQKEIFKCYGVYSEVICETGPSGEIARNYSGRRPSEILKLSWSGEHLPGKALPLLLKALAKLPSGITWQLDILGDGYCTDRWQKLAAKYGVNNHCSWHGRITRTWAIRLVHQSHVFVITSMKDLTSTVLLEALSQGVPVICPDHCGFSNVVTETCGIKIPLTTPRQFVISLADAIALLAGNEEKRRELARGALRRIQDFLWEEKVRQVNTIYQRVARN